MAEIKPVRSVQKKLRKALVFKIKIFKIWLFFLGHSVRFL
jgi:hypothetical protein